MVQGIGHFHVPLVGRLGIADVRWPSFRSSMGWVRRALLWRRYCVQLDEACIWPDRGMRNGTAASVLQWNQLRSEDMNSSVVFGTPQLLATCGTYCVVGQAF
jgi:hypothetical protein